MPRQDAGLGGTFEDMVAAEMRKGVTAQMAAQRLGNLYGFRILDHRSSLAKSAERIEARFQDLVYKYADDTGCTLDEATREVRRANPDLFKALQVV